MPEQTTPTPGTIYRDDRGRYLRVNTLTDEHANCTVIAKTVGDRIAPAGHPTGISLKKLAKMTLVDAAPELSGPDHQRIGIDRSQQTIVIDGHRIPYHLGSSGPRIKQLPDGWLVTVALRTREVGDVTLPRPIRTVHLPVDEPDHPDRIRAMIAEADQKREDYADGDITPYDYAQWSLRALPELLAALENSRG